MKQSPLWLAVLLIALAVIIGSTLTLRVGLRSRAMPCPLGVNVTAATYVPSNGLLVYCGDGSLYLEGKQLP